MTDTTAVVDGSKLTARRNSEDNRVHWYRTFDLGDSPAVSPFWAAPWCRKQVPYAARHWKPDLNTELVGGLACPVCNQASPIG